MFSKTCEYAIRAVLFIAKQSANGSRAGIKEIARGIDSPEHFIAKILQDLGRKGLVQSQKGPAGGFYLEKNSKATLADIVLAVDGDALFTGCGLGLKFCSEQHPCPLHFEFKKIRKEIYDLLKASKPDEFNKELEQKVAFLKRK